MTDRTLAWTAEIGGQRREWTAEIVDQTPDTRVAWRSTSGERNDGAVLFEPLADGGTRIVVRMEVEPDGPLETVGTALGFLDRRIQGDLERFKELIEKRGSPTGPGAARSTAMRWRSLSGERLGSAIRIVRAPASREA